jgi:prepilin-type N-terminal cleavage/methylation domain-containing protein
MPRSGFTLIELLVVISIIAVRAIIHDGLIGNL